MSRAKDLRSFLIDLSVYSLLVIVYFVLVLRFCGGWLTDLFEHHRVGYAFVAILVMIGQAAGLEVVSYFLLKWMRGKKS